MNFTLTLTFRPFEHTDRPHFTIRTELPFNVYGLQMLVDDLVNLIDDFYAPTFDLVALNPHTGEDILMELGHFDMYRYKYDFSAFDVLEDTGEQPESLPECDQGSVFDATDTENDRLEVITLSDIDISEDTGKQPESQIEHMQAENLTTD